MNLDIEIKKSLADKYGFPSHTTKARAIKSVRVATIHDWGDVINLASNGKISSNTGELLARVANAGEPRYKWESDKKACINLCKQIEKQDKLEYRLSQLKNEFSCIYTKAADLVYIQGKSQVEASKELGVDYKEVRYILDTFLYTVKNSFLYTYILRGEHPDFGCKFIMEIDGIEPKIAYRLSSVGITTTTKVKDIFNSCNTVEEAINVLRLHKRYSDANIRRTIENLVETGILDLVNLKEAENTLDNSSDEKDMYVILNKNEVIVGKITINTYLIRNTHMTNKALNKAISELVLCNEKFRLDSVRLHSMDNLGRSIYEITYSVIN